MKTPALNTISNFAKTATPFTDTTIDVVAERFIFWAIALLPLWWILGIQIFVYPIVGWFLFYRSLHRSRPVPIPFGWQLWGLYIGVWLFSLVVNLAIGQAAVGRSITALGSITGIWMLTLIVWYAVRRLGVRHRVVIRAIAIVGVSQLIAAVLGELYIRATGTIPPTQSLLTLLVPSIPARVFFEARLYNFETLEWGAAPVTRLRSFYYWAPLAGTMSIFVCMGAWNDRSRLWRYAAIAGGLITLYLAAGRAAQVGTVIAAAIALWLGSRKARQAFIWCTPILGLASPLILEKLYRYFFEFRSDSTEGRLALYQETYRAFIESPWIGFGAQGRSQVLDVPLGSHSQTLSTLYQTGLIGSAVLIIAWIAIAVSLYRMVRQHATLSPILGMWAGLTLVLMTGELAAASITVFTLASFLGSAWNYSEQRIRQRQLPWLAAIELTEPPTPWESLSRWWNGSPLYQGHYKP